MILCSKSGINIHEVIDAASTNPLSRPLNLGFIGDTVFQSTHYLLVGLLNQNIQQTLLNLQEKFECYKLTLKYL